MLMIMIQNHIIQIDMNIQIHRYEYTDTYLKIFKSCKAIHHGYTMSIADTVQARFQSNVYSYENIEKTLPKHTKRLIKDS